MCPCNNTSIFKSQNEFRIHFLRRHYNASMHSCEICRKRYATQASFEQHVDHHMVMPVKFRKMLINAVLAIRSSATQQSTAVTSNTKYVYRFSMLIGMDLICHFNIFSQINATGCSTAVVKNESNDDIVVVAQKTAHGLLNFDDMSEVEILSQSSPPPIKTIEHSDETQTTTTPSTLSLSQTAGITQLARLATQPVSIEQGVVPEVSIQIVDEAAATSANRLTDSQSVSPMDVDSGEMTTTTTTKATVAIANDEDIMDFEISRQDTIAPVRSASAMETDGSGTNEFRDAAPLVIDTEKAINSNSIDIDQSCHEHLSQNDKQASVNAENNVDELEKAVISISVDNEQASHTPPTAIETVDEHETIHESEVVRKVSTQSDGSIEEVEHRTTTDNISTAVAITDHKVTDDDDDDVAVIETANSSSDAPNVDVPAVRREPKHPCNYCSLHFITVTALNDHLKTHAYDAGATCSQVS